ncbi:MAG TPA: Rieske 2Fe-2S domain-containing protein [Solirubrobacterales bacterium]|nr:Rieske 2Fe-2S domain-containing protein [Solirubrobacterales bacterium]
MSRTSPGPEDWRPGRRQLLAAALGFLRGGGRRRRVLPPGGGDSGAELLVALLLLGSAACGAMFVVVYALDWPNLTQYLGLCLGGALGLLAAALIVVGKRIVPEEELEEEYPTVHPEDEEQVVCLLGETGARFTRKRLLGGAAAAAGAALGAALVVPAASLGPVLDTESYYYSPWRRGRRLVDEKGRPYRADDIEQEAFYTAYPEGADREQLAAPLVLVRLYPSELELPAGREGWAPGGILAYSKVCTHAGCAVALYRKPRFPQAEPAPALVCPCHYSTFDPAEGGKVIFGPAGRELPQLPLMVDAAGHLRAAGNFSGPVGPSFWGVRTRRPSA